MLDVSPSPLHELRDRVFFSTVADLIIRIVWAPAVNSIAIAENTHNLLAFGTSVGSVEVFTILSLPESSH